MAAGPTSSDDEMGTSQYGANSQAEDMADMMQVDSRQLSEVYVPEEAHQSTNNAASLGLSGPTSAAAVTGSAAEHLGGAALHPKQQQH
jgi:hypothetical protein